MRCRWHVVELQGGDWARVQAAAARWRCRTRTAMATRAAARFRAGDIRRRRANDGGVVARVADGAGGGRRRTAEDGGGRRHGGGGDGEGEKTAGTAKVNRW
jgi:hypothetical protein